MQIERNKRKKQESESHWNSVDGDHVIVVQVLNVADELVIFIFREECFCGNITIGDAPIHTFGRFITSTDYASRRKSVTLSHRAVVDTNLRPPPNICIALDSFR
eukprot:UN23172